MKALVDAFNQDKALEGAFSVIVKTNESYQGAGAGPGGGWATMTRLWPGQVRLKMNQVVAETM